MTTKQTMNDQAGINGQLTDFKKRVNEWLGRIKSPARASNSDPRRWASGMLCASVLLAVVASVGCESTNSAPPVPTEAYRSKPGGTLAPGDVIRVVFSGAPELNTQQKIQPTGKVSLPTIGEVTAAGKSVSSLQNQLSALYQPHLQDSTVTVSVGETAAGVYVSGAVLRPGKIPLDRPMTALEAVMEAGGFSMMANSRQVVIVRNQDGKVRNYVLNMHQALNNPESTPFYLRTYDVIYVKERYW